MFRAAFRRLLVIDDPPERTALAFSVGVFIAFSPLLGFHTIIATLIAFFFRFNKVAIYLGTYVNNPFLTLVPIIVVSYALGAVLLGRPFRIPPEGIELLKNPHLLTSAYYARVFTQSWYIVVPFALGATILSVICSAAAYPITLWALRLHRRRKAVDG